MKNNFTTQLPFIEVKLGLEYFSVLKCSKRSIVVNYYNYFVFPKIHFDYTKYYLLHIVPYKGNLIKIT